MKTSRTFNTAISVLLLSVLAACGGGGGGADGSDPIQEGTASLSVGASGQVEVHTTGGALVQEKTRPPMQALLANLQQRIADADVTAGLGAAPHAMIVQRMPRLTWRESRAGDPGFAIESIEVRTAQTRYPYLRYDDVGLAFSANKNQFTVDLSNPDLAQTMAQYLLQSATLRGAVGLAWEADTARIQFASGDVLAGLTEEERAARRGLIGTGGSFKPIVIDLNGDGAATTLSAADSKVFFDWNEDGFLRHSGWIAAGDGLLVIDLNADATVTNSRELFSNVNVDNSIKGVPALDWLDANRDGRLDASDPAFAWLRVWIDNGNGEVDLGEVTTLAEQGVTEIGIAASSAVRNGRTSMMLSPTLDTSDARGFRLTRTNLGYKVACTSGAQAFVTGLDSDVAVTQAVKYCGL